MTIQRELCTRPLGWIRMLMGGLLLVAWLGGCGSNGEVDKASTDQPPTPAPAGANGSNWDQMAWDQGKWR